MQPDPLPLRNADFNVICLGDADLKIDCEGGATADETTPSAASAAPCWQHSSGKTREKHSRHDGCAQTSAREGLVQHDGTSLIRNFGWEDGQCGTGQNAVRRTEPRYFIVYAGISVMEKGFHTLGGRPVHATTAVSSATAIAGGGAYAFQILPPHRDLPVLSRRMWSPRRLGSGAPSTGKAERRRYRCPAPHAAGAFPVTSY
jgi:hypothetical protein